MSFGLLSFFSIFIPGVLSFFYFNKTELNFKPFIYFVFFTIMVEVIGNFQFYSKINNTNIFILFTVIETVFFTLFLRQKMIKSSIRKVTSLILVLLFTYYFIRYLQIGFGAVMLNEIRFVSSVVIIFFAGICIINQSSNTSVFILLNPFFVIAFAGLLYHSVSIFIFGALSLILENTTQLVGQAIWKVHSIFNIISNILFAFAIWLSYRQRKLSL